MKPVFRGLLAFGERDRICWPPREGLLSSNHDPVAGIRAAAAEPPLATAGRSAAPALSTEPAADPSPRSPAAAGVPGRGPVSQPTAAGPDDHDHHREDPHEPLHDHEHAGEADGHDHAEGRCAGLLSERAWLAAQGSADAGLSGGGNVVLGTPLLALEHTFRLHSNPTATRTIYLDFNGHTTSGTAWNNGTMGSSFHSPAFSSDADTASFSNAERTLIQQAWQRVAADFSCFDVNVTTQAPPSDWLIRSGSGDVTHGMRVVITSYGPSSSSAGGIAYIDSFNWASDTPCFVYNTTLVGISEAISHEVGHTLGLSHDGTASKGYYEGHGSGETGWAPIMGVGYYKNVSSWDNGTYTGSNNGGSGANYGKGSDDLAIITGINGFSYQADLEGDSTADATPLSLSGEAVSQFGTIETALDSDWFRFQLGGSGAINISVNPYVYAAHIDSDDAWGGSLSPWYAAVSDASTSTSWVENGSNLDISLQLLNASGTTLASSNPSGLAASLAVSGLTAGTYYLRLDGVGVGTPTAGTPTGYSDHASIGDYLISGTITGTAAPLPVISLALSPASVSEDGASSLAFTLSRSGDLTAGLDVQIGVSGSATAGVDYSGLPGSGASQTVRFAPGAASVLISLDPTADTSVEADETVTLAVLNGTGYSVGEGAGVTGTILNDDRPPQPLVFSTSADLLTGSAGSTDTYALNRLGDALISGGSGISCDRIVGLETGLDRIDTPSSRTTAIRPRQLGSVTELTATAIGKVLNARKAFARNGASTFTYNDPLAGQRTFLALNNGTTSFSTAADAVIEISGYNGNLATLAVF
ncbi:MAG: hypothetical protein RLZZ219_798 [Cyanobacteriota bacterium]